MTVASKLSLPVTPPAPSGGRRDTVPTRKTGSGDGATKNIATHGSVNNPVKTSLTTAVPTAVTDVKTPFRTHLDRETNSKGKQIPNHNKAKIDAARNILRRIQAPGQPAVNPQDITNSKQKDKTGKATKLVSQAVVENSLIQNKTLNKAMGKATEKVAEKKTAKKTLPGGRDELKTGAKGAARTEGKIPAPHEALSRPTSQPTRSGQSKQTLPPDIKTAKGTNKSQEVADKVADKGADTIDRAPAVTSTAALTNIHPQSRSKISPQAPKNTSVRQDISLNSAPKETAVKTAKSTAKTSPGKDNNIAGTNKVPDRNITRSNNNDAAPTTLVKNIRADMSAQTEAGAKKSDAEKTNRKNKQQPSVILASQLAAALVVPADQHKVAPSSPGKTPVKISTKDPVKNALENQINSPGAKLLENIKDASDKKKSVTAAKNKAKNKKNTALATGPTPDIANNKNLVDGVKKALAPTMGRPADSPSPLLAGTDQLIPTGDGKNTASNQVPLSAGVISLQEASRSQIKNSSPGTTTNLASVSPQMVTKQISLAIARQSGDDSQIFKISLKPAGLGKVEIKMDIQKDGKIIATVTVDNQRTLNLLHRDQQSLQKTLADSGFDAGGNNLNFTLKQQHQSPQDYGSSHNNSTGDDETDPMPILPHNIISRQQMRMAYSNNILDINI